MMTMVVEPFDGLDPTVEKNYSDSFDREDPTQEERSFYLCFKE